MFTCLPKLVSQSSPERQYEEVRTVGFCGSSLQEWGWWASKRKPRDCWFSSCCVMSKQPKPKSCPPVYKLERGPPPKFAACWTPGLRRPTFTIARNNHCLTQFTASHKRSPSYQPNAQMPYLSIRNKIKSLF